MRNKRILFGSIVTAGLAALAGSAFTASNTMPADIVHGYGEQAITGVVAESIDYNLNGIKDTVDSVTVVLTGDTTALTVQTAFNNDVPVTCDGAGAYDNVEDATTYTCTANQATDSIDRFVLFAST